MDCSKRYPGNTIVTIRHRLNYRWCSIASWAFDYNPVICLTWGHFSFSMDCNAGFLNTSFIHLILLSTPWYWFLLLPFQLYCRLKLKQTYPTIGDVAWNEQWFDFFATYLALTMRTSQSMKSREWSNQSNYSRNQSCEFSSLSFRMQSLVLQSHMRNVKAVNDGIDKHFRANEIILESLGNVFGSILRFVWNQLHLLYQGH